MSAIDTLFEKVSTGNFVTTELITSAWSELAQLSARAAEADALRAERDELQSALELGQINCDAEYADLRQQLSNECLTAVQLRATVAAQAQTIETAREAIAESQGALIGAGLGGCYAEQACRAWLAPMPMPTQGETESEK